VGSIRPGVFTIFLRDEKNQKKWMDKLEKATSCYKIKYYYDFKYSSKQKKDNDKDQMKGINKDDG
jgi:hypothetical protein